MAIHHSVGPFKISSGNHVRQALTRATYKFRNPKKWYICSVDSDKRLNEISFPICILHSRFGLPLTLHTHSRHIGQVISSVVAALPNTKRAIHFHFQFNTTAAAHWCATKKRSNFPARKAKNRSRWMSIRTDCCCSSHRRMKKKCRNREHLMYPTAIKLNHPK